jgi:hypothetical protein
MYSYQVERPLGIVDHGDPERVGPAPGNRARSDDVAGHAVVVCGADMVARTGPAQVLQEALECNLHVTWIGRT